MYTYTESGDYCFIDRGMIDANTNHYGLPIFILTDTESDDLNKITPTFFGNLICGISDTKTPTSVSDILLGFEIDFIDEDLLDRTSMYSAKVKMIVDGSYASSFDIVAETNFALYSVDLLVSGNSRTISIVSSSDIDPSFSVYNYPSPLSANIPLYNVIGAKKEFNEIQFYRRNHGIYNNTSYLDLSAPFYKEPLQRVYYGISATEVTSIKDCQFIIEVFNDLINIYENNNLVYSKNLLRGHSFEIGIGYAMAWEESFGTFYIADYVEDYSVIYSSTEKILTDPTTHYYYTSTLYANGFWTNLVNCRELT